MFMCILRFLHELSFNINFYEMSKGSVIKRALYIFFLYIFIFIILLSMLYCFVRTSFIEVYIKITMDVSFFLSHDFLACTDPPLDTFYLILACCVLGYIRQV